MESTLSTKAYKYKLPEVSFTPDGIPRHLSLTFQPEVCRVTFFLFSSNYFVQRKSHILDGQRESFVGIILAVAIIFIGAQYQKVS